jgi:nucleotide sugar dehydrogenase
VPPVLHLNPIEVDTSKKRSEYRVAVVGCGHKGIFFANAFAEAGFNVVCTDADASVVKKLAKGKTAFANPAADAKLRNHVVAEKINVTGDHKKAVSQSDIVIVAINTKVDEQKKTDYNGLLGTCKQVGAALRQGALVVYCGISSLGFMESTMKELLENTSGLKAGSNFGLAYCPVISTDIPLAKTELTLSATDESSLKSAEILLKTLTANIRLLSDLKIAEVAALFAIAKEDTTTALNNELAIFCESANIDYYKVLEALKLNYPEFRPTINEEYKHEAYLLIEDSENLNAKLRLPVLARQINENMVKHTVNLTQRALRGCGKTLRRAHVAVLGQFSSSSATSTYVKLIEQKGAIVTVYDPALKKESRSSVKTGLSDAVKGADCTVLLFYREQFNRLNLKKLKSLMKSPPIIVDLVGKFEPAQAETEGFIYAGLGRGTDKK